MLRTIGTLLVILSLAGSADAVSKSKGLKALDNKYGFRDVRFETPQTASRFADCEIYEESGDSDYSRCEADKLSIGEAELKSISYGFYKGMLGTVNIQAKGYSNSRALLRVLVSAYGEGYKPNRFIERYYWFGKLVNVSFSENSITHDATVWFSSKAIAARRKADKKAKADAAADEL